MPNEVSAVGLTVWVGSARFGFAPGRDAVVGYGPGCDIALERLAPATAPPAPRQDVVLRFTGTQWVAIDVGHQGLFVDGSRVSSVEIRDGLAVLLGDPHRGPRLVFQTAQRRADPAHPPTQPGPPPRPANQPSPAPPTESATRRMRVVPPPAVPPPMAQPVVPPPVAPEPEPGQGPSLIERLVTSKIRVQRPSFRTADPSSTYRLPLRPGSRTLGVTAHRLGVVVDGHPTLSDISMTARPASLTAIIGPSAARNSALLDLLSGTKDPTAGVVTVDGHDVHAEPAAMRSRIGIVARDDRLHRRLTTAQTLRFAAELRLPPDVTAEHRDRVVEQVIEELDLGEHRDTRIGKLAPEVRRCAALAVELLTRPTLLVVDEPAAGLDPAQQRHVMGILRRQADIGCVVVVAMSPRAPLTELNLCDQVLVLTAAGAPAYLGAPLQVEAALGTADWSQVLARVSADPDGTHGAFRGRPAIPAATAPPPVAAPWPPTAELSRSRQVRLLARRDLRLALADRAYAALLALLPFALAGLTLLIPGSTGLGRPDPQSTNVHEAMEILAALNLAAVLIGTTLTIRTVVCERAIFRREQALGLSAVAYLAAKILVFGLAATALSAVPFAIVLATRAGPAYGAVLLHNATIELYLTVAVTAIVSAVVGLALSTLGTSLREVLPLLVPVILASLLFNGSLVQLASKWGLQQLSWFVPAQWGFAAGASTVNLHRIDPLAANALMWAHYSGWWVFDMAMLLLFGLAAAGLALYRLRSRRRLSTPPQQPREPATAAA